jgi:hypothetical protein
VTGPLDRALPLEFVSVSTKTEAKYSRRQSSSSIWPSWKEPALTAKQASGAGALGAAAWSPLRERAVKARNDESGREMRVSGLGRTLAGVWANPMTRRD